MKKVVVLTGAGISAESGIKTFRDSGGLWEEYSIYDVASYDGWIRNPDLVLDFYNKRRKQALEVVPNEGHTGLVQLEDKFDVQIITQNVDDLHERAGSKNILHLHGELFKVRSTGKKALVYGWTSDLVWGDKCENGFQLRPHIVWFGEEVPAIVEAADLVSKADILIIIGTSLNVYPAAGLIDLVKKNTTTYIIDIEIPTIKKATNTFIIKKKASEGIKELLQKLLNN